VTRRATARSWPRAAPVSTTSVPPIGEDFDVGEVAHEVDTLGGYLVTKAGHVPVRGELVPGPEPFEAEVLDADPRRVKRVRIYLRQGPAPCHGTRTAPAGENPPSASGAARGEHPARTRTRRGHRDAADSCHRAVLGLAAPTDRVCGRRALALAMAPFNAWPVLFLTFPTLVWLIDGAGRSLGRSGRRGAVGWWFGFGYFLAGLYWIGYAFLVDAPDFGWLCRSRSSVFRQCLPSTPQSASR